MDRASERTTYLLVDGENIDATLGSNIFGGRRPSPQERPRWEKVRDFAADTWGQPVKALFFLNASSGQLPLPFIQALLALDYQPIPLAGGAGEKVVDIGIQRTLEALASRTGDAMLASHDGDFFEQVQALLTGDRKVGLLGFREFVNSRFSELAGIGLEVFDLEDDARCFNERLPRVRIIDIDRFDPIPYL